MKSQVGHGQRRLQVGQDVVRGAQIEGQSRILAGLVGLKVEIADL